VTEIQQKGNDFTITSKTPGKTVTNSFTIGKEAEITTMDGKKLKVEYNSRLCNKMSKFEVVCAGAQFHNRSNSSFSTEQSTKTSESFRLIRPGICSLLKVRLVILRVASNSRLALK